MFSDQELTQHIRNIFRAGENEELQPAAGQSYRAIVDSYETWKSEFGDSSEMPPVIYRIHRVLGFLDGTIKDVNVNEDPWVTVSMLEMNLLNRQGEIDLMPTMQVPKMIRDWQGEPGTEPDWLLEADRLLCAHHYRALGAEFGLSQDEIDELLEGTPQERAAAFTFFG